MKFRILLLSLVSLLAFNLDAQIKGKKQLNHPHSESVDHVHNTGCMLYENDRTSDVFIPFGNKETDVDGKSGNAPNAVFDVDYFGFSTEAQGALQFAFDALSQLITSSVPIRVSATYEEIDEGALGGANAAGWRILNGSWYPIAMAEKIMGRELNAADEYDITLTINNQADWHFDPTDSTTIGNKYDLATVMMHEIIHGLGFTGFAGVNDAGLGFITASDANDIFTEEAVYDTYLENNSGVPLVDIGTEGSTERGSAITSGQLFFIIPNLDNKVQQIYAPLNYSGGSSIYHLDENATDPADFMMTPFASRGEIRSDPGVSTQMLLDMGWDYTAIVYEQGEEFSEDLSQGVPVSAEIITDSGFDTSSVSLVYSVDTFKVDINAVTLIYNPSTDKFEGSIPAPNAEALYQYKIELDQNNHRFTTISSPPFLTSEIENFYSYSYIKDVIPPVITHTDLQNINSTDVSFQIKAAVVDSFAMTGVVFDASSEVDTVYIEYAVNGGTLATAGGIISTDGFEEFFLASGTLSGSLTADDMLTYRIIAVDASEAANTAMYPTDGSFISVPVIEVFDPVTDYINDFEDLQNDDFTLDRFQIGFVTGIESPVLMNRDHPYRTAGSGSINFSATLKAPIIIAADSAAAFIKFKEIVLVEPGESGTTYTDTEFWDYVIIEAKKLSGGDWEPLVDGYDARQQPSWKAVYENNIPPGLQTSSGKPNQNMYRSKEFSFLGGDSPFAPSDTVLVRFRLFSDPAANGWGWMIENLNIQNPDVNVAVEDFIETNDFVVYPNPTSTGMINVSATFTQSAKNLRTELRDIHGRLINIQQISDGAKAYDNTIDVSDLPAGVYFMTLRDTESAITRKVVKY